MDREQQRRRISAWRRTIIGGATASSLALAGWLGLGVHGAAATATDGGTTTDQGSTDQGSTDQGSTRAWGGGPDSSLTGGSGSPDATTQGS